MYMYPIIDTNVQVQLPHVHTTMYKIININMYEVHVQAECPEVRLDNTSIYLHVYTSIKHLSHLAESSQVESFSSPVSCDHSYNARPGHYKTRAHIYTCSSITSFCSCRLSQQRPQCSCLQCCCYGYRNGQSSFMHCLQARSSFDCQQQ